MTLIHTIENPNTSDWFCSLFEWNSESYLSGNGFLARGKAEFVAKKDPGFFRNEAVVLPLNQGLLQLVGICRIAFEESTIVDPARCGHVGTVPKSGNQSESEKLLQLFEPLAIDQEPATKRVDSSSKYWKSENI